MGKANTIKLLATHYTYSTHHRSHDLDRYCKWGVNWSSII